MKKFVVGFAVMALALGVAVSASAQTTSVADLQAMIATLQAQIAALSGGSSTSGASSVTFTRDLTLGSSGADVTALQNWLIGKGFTIPAGATGYFGAQTQSALARYQASAGITPASGYFGPLTRASVSAMGGTPSTGTTPTTPKPMSGDEGQLKDVDQISGGIEDEVAEGEEVVEVIGFEYTADDSDMTIERVDVEFDYDSLTDGSEDLDDYIESVSLLHNGKVVDELDVDEADEDTDDNFWSFRFTGLDITTDEGETDEITIAVSAINNVDTQDEDDDWTVRIPTDGIRAVDGAGISDTYGTAITETFNVGSLASIGNLELQVGEGDADINDEHVELVDDASETNDVSILSFTLEADGSDITINEIPVLFDATGADVDVIANRATLWMGDTELDEVTIPSSAGDTYNVNFDDMDEEVVIEDGDEVEFTVKVDVNDLDGTTFAEGDELLAGVSQEQIDAEDENGDDIVAADLTGSATSSGVAFYTEGIEVEFVSASSDNDDASNESGVAQDVGTYEIVFDVTALEETVFIDADVIATATPNAGTDGISWATTTNSTNGVGTTTQLAVLEAEDDDSQDVTTATALSFRVEAGETRRFTLTVKIPAQLGSAAAAVRLTGIKWDTDSGDAHANLYNFDLGSFKTGLEVLENS